MRNDDLLKELKFQAEKYAAREESFQKMIDDQTEVIRVAQRTIERCMTAKQVVSTATDALREQYRNEIAKGE